MNNTPDVRDLWGKIQTICLRRSAPRIPIFKINNNTLCEPGKVADALAHHYSKVFHPHFQNESELFKKNIYLQPHWSIR